MCSVLQEEAVLLCSGPEVSADEQNVLLMFPMLLLSRSTGFITYMSSVLVAAQRDRRP